MIAGAWLAFSSAVFALLSIFLVFFNRHIDMTESRLNSRWFWHLGAARELAGAARDLFAFLACVALFWHLCAGT